STAASNNNLSTFVGAFYRPIIAPLWDNLDIDSLSGAAFSYLTTGSAPNRVFTAEWKNAEWNWFANDATISFQVRLYESTGVIEYVYNQESGNLFSPSASICIGGVNNNQFLSLNNSGSTPSVSSTVSTNNINTKPSSGQQYTFTPPIPTSVSTISFSNITPTAVTVNWTSVTGAVKYAVYHSIDNVNFTYSGSSPSNSLLVNGLFPNTTYYFKVYSISEGAYGTNPATGFSSTQNGVVSGTISIPTNAPSITSVLDSIKQSGIGGPVTIELENTYLPNLERFPITLSDTLGTSANAPLVIRAAATATNVEIYTNQNNVSTFLFTGARYVTIDGRPGGTGNTRVLTIRANNYSNAIDIYSYNTIQNNIELKYINLKAVSGAISIPAFVEIYGYFNTSLANTSINNCIIGDSNIMATMGIRAYSFNQSNTVNNSITDNIIFNTGNSNSGFGISITGNSNNTWYIERNHLFNLLPLSGNTSQLGYYCIYVTGANAHIKNNFIGGSEVNCGGTPFEVGPAANNNIFCGIYFAGVANQFTSIQGNTIANFFWPGTSIQPWTGIYIQSGRALIGDTVGNTIGDPTGGTTSIYVLSQITTNTPVAYGIRTITTSNVIIKNNSITGINATGVNSTYPCSVNAINVSSTTQANISDNTIGSTVYPNSIRAASPNGFYPQSAIGIQVASTSFGALNITGNTIANMGNSGISTSLQNYACGIFVTGNLSTNISNNNINNLF
ncbi:MAG: fibronectin type III domain-containing protein, partial [Bacteroidia bacterium]